MVGSEDAVMAPQRLQHGARWLTIDRDLGPRIKDEMQCRQVPVVRAGVVGVDGLKRRCPG